MGQGIRVQLEPLEVDCLLSGIFGLLLFEQIEKAVFIISKDFQPIELLFELIRFGAIRFGLHEQMLDPHFVGSG